MKLSNKVKISKKFKEKEKEIIYAQRDFRKQLVNSEDSITKTRKIFSERPFAKNIRIYNPEEIRFYPGLNSSTNRISYDKIKDKQIRKNLSKELKLGVPFIANPHRLDYDKEMKFYKRRINKERNGDY